MKQINAKILNNEQIAPHAYKIVLSAQQIARIAKPGQFVMVKTSDTHIPLLRRPLGVHCVNLGNIELLYEVVGEGTRLLSQRKVGEFLDILGPLGNGFNYTLYAKRYPPPILIAGGMGTAPLLFLAQKLENKLMVLIGAKTKSELLCENDFRALGCDVRIATDDGSKGHKGFVTDLLKDLLSAKRYPLACRDSKPGQALNAIYACGPREMLREIAGISKRYRIPAQVSLEEHMACGIGACLGCVVNTESGYKRVCKEGPVFNAEEIIWEEGRGR